MDYRVNFNRTTLIAFNTIAVIFVMWSIALTTVEGNSLFNPPVNYGAGIGPDSVAIGDLNGDGDLDLTVANDVAGSVSDNVSVLLGNGDGSFQSALNYITGNGSSSVAIDDLNGDGDSDLVVTNIYSDNVSVLLGNGDGTFQSSINYITGDGSSSVAIDDLNKDGNLDLVVTNMNSNNVSVLLGDGDGSFQSAINYGAVDGPYSVAIGDLNEDGNPDLAMANWKSNNVSVLLGNGDGSFQNPEYYDTGPSSSSVAIGDLNKDDNLDLAVANRWSDNVSVLLGNGDGSFQSAKDYSAGDYPHFVAIGDLNGDGDQDLAVANMNSSNVSVLSGNGDGSFQSALNYITGSSPRSVAMGDLNEDGDLDLVAANKWDDNVSILINTGGGPKFEDVPPGFWAEDAIYKIYNAGITTGCSKNPLMYCPENPVYRDQMAVFLGRATHGSKFTPPAATGIFADVPKSYWAADWIEQFYADGLTKGCKIDPHDVQSPTIYYCPKYPVTRTTMAIFLLRAKHGANYQPPPATGIFEDVWVNYWAADWIEQLYKEGITKGCKSNPLMYCPSKHVTRSQMAVFLARILGL